MKSAAIPQLQYHCLFVAVYWIRFPPACLNYRWRDRARPPVVHALYWILQGLTTWPDQIFLGSKSKWCSSWKTVHQTSIFNSIWFCCFQLNTASIGFFVLGEFLKVKTVQFPLFLLLKLTSNLTHLEIVTARGQAWNISVQKVMAQQVLWNRKYRIRMETRVKF